MLEVLSAVKGESIAVFEKEDVADALCVKALKKRLAQKIGVPRFQLRLLQGNCQLDDNYTLTDDQTCTQLVKMEFLPPDMEQDGQIMEASFHNNDKLLEQHLNQPRSPNFKDGNGMTPLYAAASNGSLKCVQLLLEAGAETDKGHRDTGMTPLFCWLSPVPTKTKARQT